MYFKILNQYRKKVRAEKSIFPLIPNKDWLIYKIKIFALTPLTVFCFISSSLFLNQKSLPGFLWFFVPGCIGAALLILTAFKFLKTIENEIDTNFDFVGRELAYDQKIDQVEVHHLKELIKNEKYESFELKETIDQYNVDARKLKRLNFFKFGFVLIVFAALLNQFFDWIYTFIIKENLNAGIIFLFMIILAIGACSLLFRAVTGFMSYSLNNRADELKRIGRQIKIALIAISSEKTTNEERL